MKQQTKHMIFSLCINSWQTQCWDVPKCLGGVDLYSMKSKLGTPTPCALFLLYPFNTDINIPHLKYPMSPEHHHMMPDITTWCPSDVMLFLVGMYVHVYGMLSGHLCSEGGCQSRCSHPPHIGWDTVTPGAYCDTLPKIFWCVPMLSQPGYDLLLKTYQKYNWHGMYKDQPKQMIKICKTWV